LLGGRSLPSPKIRLLEVLFPWLARLRAGRAKVVTVATHTLVADHGIPQTTPQALFRELRVDVIVWLPLLQRKGGRLIALRTGRLSAFGTSSGGARFVESEQLELRLLFVFACFSSRLNKLVKSYDAQRYRVETAVLPEALKVVGITSGQRPLEVVDTVACVFPELDSLVPRGNPKRLAFFGSHKREDKLEPGILAHFYPVFV
jgi:hypothetical protein